MADFNARNNRAVMTVPELAALEQLVKSGDRAGFYLAYYGMTDSAEALMQSKIATFSGLVGGAAFAANRFLQDQYAGNARLARSKRARDRSRWRERHPKEIFPQFKSIPVKGGAREVFNHQFAFRISAC